MYQGTPSRTTAANSNNQTWFGGTMLESTNDQQTRRPNDNAENECNLLFSTHYAGLVHIATKHS